MSKGGRPRKSDPVATDISFAIENNNTAEAKALVGSNNLEVTDGEGRTPIIYAAFKNNVDMLVWLIDQGANINHQDRNGWCALHAAAQNGHLNIIAVLIQYGAQPNLTDSYGNGPLWTATMNSKRNETDVMSALINAGADIDHKNKSDRSPFAMMKMKEKNWKLMNHDCTDIKA